MAFQHVFETLRAMIGERYPDAEWVFADGRKKIVIGYAIGYFYEATGTFQVQGRDSHEKEFLNQVKERMTSHGESLRSAQSIMREQEQAHLARLEDALATFDRFSRIIQDQGSRIDHLEHRCQELSAQNEMLLEQNRMLIEQNRTQGEQITTLFNVMRDHGWVVD